jgi:uroporphyrin-III C-methyltransferase/precorrin-2 dehydrogenase/sirohydrochlorin ferrochelatase
VIQDGTMRIQRSARATLATVAEVVRAREIAPPAVIVVGAVAGLVDAATGRVTDG